LRRIENVKLINDHIYPMLKNSEILTGTIKGILSAPSSKSITHRLLLINALSGKPAKILNPLLSDDTLITAKALENVGFDIKIKKKEIRLNQKKQKIPKNAEIFVNNSGTSARFLTSILSLFPLKIYLDGTERMRQRPMQPLLQSLTELGAKISHNNGCLPLEMEGGFLHSGETFVHSSKSSQFISSLALIAPFLNGKTILRHQAGIASEPYFKMTLTLMNQSGIKFERLKDSIIIEGPQQYSPLNIKVEGDYSSISYFIIATAITQGILKIYNLHKESIQGDHKIVGMAEKAGAKIEWLNDYLKISGGFLHGFDIDMKDTPDLVPAVAVLALCSEGTSRLGNISILQYKESNRIQAIMENIKIIGGKSYCDGNDLIIESQPIHGALIDDFNDHRIAMSFAVLGLKIPGIKIKNPDCVNKSYPDFWKDLNDLRHTG
jgi:3-phosphoshikimate 1-carboxyvinyltransferase